MLIFNHNLKINSNFVIPQESKLLYFLYVEIPTGMINRLLKPIELIGEFYFRTLKAFNNPKSLLVLTLKFNIMNKSEEYLLNYFRIFFFKSKFSLKLIIFLK